MGAGKGEGGSYYNMLWGVKKRQGLNSNGTSSPANKLIRRSVTL